MSHHVVAEKESAFIVLRILDFHFKLRIFEKVEIKIDNLVDYIIHLGCKVKFDFFINLDLKREKFPR